MVTQTGIKPTLFQMSFDSPQLIPQIRSEETVMKIMYNFNLKYTVPSSVSFYSVRTREWVDRTQKELAKSFFFKNMF